MLRADAACVLRLKFRNTTTDHLKHVGIAKVQLQAAKALIDQCVTRWAEGANDNIKVLINDAFQVDKAGKINTDRVLGLRRLDIKDEDWLQAMQAISDSIQVASTKPYIRFYKRNSSGGYDPITLDLAAV